jgi:hypothetical protein
VDLRIYYQKIREQAEELTDDFPVVVSTETQDGGKAGVLTEVPRVIAARMIVDGRARKTSPEESKKFREQKASAKLAADELEAAGKVQYELVPLTGKKKG